MQLVCPLLQRAKCMLWCAQPVLGASRLRQGLPQLGALHRKRPLVVQAARVSNASYSEMFVLQGDRTLAQGLR